MNTCWNKLLFDSWIDTKGNVSQNQDIDQWIDFLNKTIEVTIEKSKLKDSSYWFYDENKGIITNKNNSFFYIQGIQEFKNGKLVNEQPIIFQNEIGFLGIICSVIDGQLNFLMQAKIEPGNINQIQISPTIQATKSNFTQKHGGKKPLYLEYFTNVLPDNIIVDQIQSEQSSRFFHKRNRNIVIMVNDDIEMHKNFKWMTLGQIKRLMRFDNIVNMDTRTVISCLPILPFEDENEKINFINRYENSEFLKSVFDVNQNNLVRAFHRLNNIKMFENKEYKYVDLKKLQSWTFYDNEISNKNSDFKVVFCDIKIEGREVTHWTQPLFEATGIAMFGLITRIHNNTREYLVHLKEEIGCFDLVEFGPTIQLESKEIIKKKKDIVEDIFFKYLKTKDKVIFDTLLSEEGGRFYHEQNRNIIIDIQESDIEITEQYIWLDYSTINQMIQFNNVCNIQLRNLMSLLEI